MTLTRFWKPATPPSCLRVKRRKRPTSLRSGALFSCRLAGDVDDAGLSCAGSDDQGDAGGGGCGKCGEDSLQGVIL